MVVAVVTVLAAVGRLGRNSLAGIRIPSLYASNEAWVNGHRAAVLPVAVGAIACVVLALVALADPAFAPLGTTLETVVLVVGVLVGTILARRAARRHGNEV